MLFQGDCFEAMKELPINTVDLILTSPPYAIGKDYDETVDLDHFIVTTSAKLKEKGVFAWQVGNRVNDGFIEPIDMATHGTFTGLGFKMINRVAWTFGHGAHCRNRLSGRYETICIYSRSKDYTFNLDDIRIPQKYPQKKHYKGPKKGQLSGNPLGKNPADVWDITNVKNNHPEKTEHPCQFPEELCSRIVRAFSNKGEVVMDPFMGSGTTGKVAKDLGRKFIGIEMDTKFFNIAKERIGEEDE